MKEEHDDLFKLLDEEIVSDLHNKGKQYIDRLSSIKMRYKKLALTWAGAYLFGLFYICLYEEPVVHVNKYNLMAFATVFAIFGIKLIQFLDINIGHEQLRNIFKYLLLYETKETSLVKPYTKVEMILYDKNFDPVFLDFLFYLSINFSLAILGVLALVLKLQAQFFPIMLVFIGFAVLFLGWQSITLIYLNRGRHRKVHGTKKST